jgi:hypothetical protein
VWHSGAVTATDRATIVNGPIFTVNGVSDFFSTLSVYCYIYCGGRSSFGCLLGGFPAGMAYRFLAKAFDGRLLPFLCVCSNSLVTHFDLGALVAFWTSMLCL